MSGTDLLLLLSSILICALCSGLEIAVVSSNKLYIELERQKGSIRARLLTGLLHRPSRIIGSLLVGNTIALVLYGSLMSNLLAPWLRGIGPGPGLELITATLVSTLLILVIGEFVPKLLFRMDPNGGLALFALPLRILHTVLWLPMMVVTGLGGALLKLVGIRGRSGQVAFGRIDLDDFLKEMSSAQNGDRDMDAEVEYFKNTLELSNIKVRDLMVPRAEIQAIQVDASIPTLHSTFVDSGMSKLLVYKDSIDNMLGYVHGYELFREPRSIRAIMRPIDFIPGTMPADEVLQLFIKQRTHVAVVVDEFGGTAGMLTMEDVVETIVGDIEDEHDIEEDVEEQVGPHEYLFSARTDVSHLAAKYRLAIPESADYDTLAGYILHSTGELPEQGDVIDLPPFRITIAQVVHSRIDLVRLQVMDTATGYSAS